MADVKGVLTEYHGRVRTEVLELVPHGFKSVLDIGGGTGASAKYLKEIGKAESAVVVDMVADHTLEEVDAAYAGDLEDPKLLEKVAAEQGKFDVILCLDVLEHLTDPWSVVAQCHGMLRPGGVIVASIPNMRNYTLVLPLVFSGKFELQDSGIRDRTHLRWFVRQSAIDLMTSSGLSLEHVQGKYYGRRHLVLDKLSFGLLQNFLYLQYFIRVRRPA